MMLSLLVYLGFITYCYGLPQSNSMDLFNSGSLGSDSNNIGPYDLGKNAIKFAADIKHNAIKSGTDLAKMTLTAGTTFGSQGLHDATNFIGHSLDFGRNLTKDIPILGQKLTFIINLFKTGLNAANSIGQSGLQVINHLGNKGISALDSATKLKLNALNDLGKNFNDFKIIKDGNSEKARLNNMFTILMNNLKMKIGNLTKDLKQDNRTSVVKIEEDTENIVNDLKILSNNSLVKNVLSNIRKAIKNQSDKDGIVKDILELNRNEISDMGVQVRNIANDLVILFNNNKTNGKISETYGKLKNDLTNILDDFKIIFDNNNGKSINKLIESFLNDVKSFLENKNNKILINDISKQFHNIINEIGSVITTDESFQKFKSEFAKEFSGYLGQLKEFISNHNLSNIIKHSGPAINVLKQYVQIIGNLINS